MSAAPDDEMAEIKDKIFVLFQLSRPTPLHLCCSSPPQPLLPLAALLDHNQVVLAYAKCAQLFAKRGLLPTPPSVTYPSFLNHLIVGLLSSLRFVPPTELVRS